MPQHVEIRPAGPGDVAQIFAMVCELAEYERARHAVTGTTERLGDALFGPQPAVEALVAELPGDRSQPTGFALFFPTFSTWECRQGVWLEDLYVREPYRGSGVGGALLSRVAAIALERGCARLEWSALDWNRPALDFYAKLGAQPLREWLMLRLDGPALTRVAALAQA